MAGHSYWRIYCAENNVNSWSSVGDIWMAESPGGDDVCVGGSSFSSDGDGHEAFDRDQNTYWATPHGNNLWIGYHFPTPVDIVEVTLRMDTEYLGQCFKRFWVEWSDDGTTWTRHFGVPNASGWSRHETRTFTKPGYTGNARFWGLLFRDRQGNGAFGDPSYVYITELYLNDADGTRLTGSGTAFASDYNGASVAARAFDGDTGTGWQAGGDARPVLGYDFGSSVSVAEIGILSGGNADLAPLNFAVVVSNDGAVLDVAGLFSTSSWSSNETRTVDAPAAPALDESESESESESEGGGGGGGSRVMIRGRSRGRGR
jgi:hypothetical protein